MSIPLPSPLPPLRLRIRLRTLFWLALLLGCVSARAATGLAELPATGKQPAVAVFYPTTAEGPPVQRFGFALPLVEGAPPQRGNGRLVVISHGSPSNPWVNADLAVALVQAGFVVAAPWHQRDNSDDSADAGPTAWARRPAEVSAAIDTVARDARFGPLVDKRRVGAYGMSAGGHTMLTLAGGRWSAATLRDHCLRHLAQDFAACTGPFIGLDGGWLDGLKLTLAGWALRWFFRDETWHQHRDERIAAIVAGVPFAADFEPFSLAQPVVPLALITAQQDVWLRSSFHGDAVLRQCQPRCERLADLVQGGHAALLSPLPQRSGRIGELIQDPPGFDRAREVPALNAQIARWFAQRLLP